MVGMNVLDELVRTGCLVSRELNFRELASTLVEQSIDVTRSDLACLYIYADPGGGRNQAGGVRLFFRRGRFSAPDRMEISSPLIEFILENREAVALTERKRSPFSALLLDDRMQSGVALPLATSKQDLGILILNSLDPLYYDRERFHFLDSLTKLAGGMLHNSRLYRDLQDSMARILELERYQENIFSSMTNSLITTDKKGKVRYFNRAAKEGLNLTEDLLGKSFPDLFRNNLDASLLRNIEESAAQKKTLLGVEGIFMSGDNGQKELDFSLNVSPLLGERGKHEGTTFLLTDQTREKELQEQMKGVVEERRMIKNMFARYLSMDLVHSLIQHPEQVKPGGSSRFATVFFADIRGYTSFSEGYSAEYIIEVLNEYFQEAVEVVIRNHGYIDKFIGDCIMAAWGVPIENPAEDAISAVSCAVEIQELVASKNRKFFHGKANDLRIGIGMHTGPLVAGNLGSTRKMNYTVIGDTVNLASRLEGISKANEIIITKHTRDHLGDHFRIEERPAVQVKGKRDPIPIFSVIGKA
jgi:PAS domain S-box-containing protein